VKKIFYLILLFLSFAACAPKNNSNRETPQGPKALGSKIESTEGETLTLESTNLTVTSPDIEDPNISNRVFVENASLIKKILKSYKFTTNEPMKISTWRQMRKFECAGEGLALVKLNIAANNKVKEILMEEDVALPPGDHLLQLEIENKGGCSVLDFGFNVSLVANLGQTSKDK
jgi:hypothetical protein